MTIVAVVEFDYVDKAIETSKEFFKTLVERDSNTDYYDNREDAECAVTERVEEGSDPDALYIVDGGKVTGVQSVVMRDLK